MAKKKQPPCFNPELDGNGRVLSPVKKRHLPKQVVVDSPLATALREAIARKGVKA